MDAPAFERALEELAREIVEKTSGFDGRLALVGVRTRGVPLSKRLAQLIEGSTGRRPDLGALDITLYRDDLSAIAQQPVVRRTELPFAVDDAWIVLVDDVLYSGRTARAAITALIDFGRPRIIQLLVIVDRGWRELPIHADYTGITLETTRRQMVHVHVDEEDGRDEVVLSE
jgi:pyrimidine operon attenuation protein / uracil phosphoribosyltransferase